LFSPNFHKESSFISSLEPWFFVPTSPSHQTLQQTSKKSQKENRSVLSKVSQHLSYDPTPPLLFSKFVTTTSCHEMIPIIVTWTQQIKIVMHPNILHHIT
jgi:hypothetical protein